MNDLTNLIKRQFDDIGSLILTLVWAGVKIYQLLVQEQKILNL